MADEETKQAALEFVKRKLQEGGCEFQVATSSWRYCHRSVADTQLARVWAAQTPFSSHVLGEAMTSVAFYLTDGEIRLMKARMAVFDIGNRDDTTLRRWLRLLERMGTGGQHHEASVLVMKQWVWQVKQAVAQRKARYHVTPIFWSREQGTGKSFNVLRILEPLTVFTRHLFVDALDDNFGASMMANTYVAFLDEFAGADRVNGAKLKALMSGKEIQQRGMHSMGGVSVDNRASFIATSNEDPPHGLEDVTGARRFWSIHCSGKSMQKDAVRRRAFDAIDVHGIWSCVHTDDASPMETAPERLISFMDHVREDALRAKTSVESFISDECLRDPQAEHIPLKAFREQQTRYAWETKQIPLKGSYKTYATALRNSGVDVVNSKGYWYVKGVRIRDDGAA